MKELTKDNYRLFKDKTIAVLKVEASWCGPCKMMTPVLHEVEQSHLGDLPFYSVDVDSEPEIADMYGVKSVPTILFFKNGMVVNRLSGISSKKKIAHSVTVLLQKP